jgi:hypothetical protein
MFLPELDFRIAEFIQDRSNFGIVSTNGAHLIAWMTYYGKKWATNYETWYKDSATHLLKDPNVTMEVTATSILFQPVTDNIHYPKTNKWSQDVITDLNSEVAGYSTQKR